MWEFTDHAVTEEKKQIKNAASRQPEGSTSQMKYEAGTSKSSYESICIQYSMPARETIQLKQTTPLADRLREQGIALETLGREFMELVTIYDNLPNTADTRDAQQRHLYALLDLLRERLHPDEETPRIKTALNILQDELSFVGIQNLDRTPASPAHPWEHLSSSPFIRMIAEVARMDAQGYKDAQRHHQKTQKAATTSEASTTSEAPTASEASITVEPVRDIPTQEDFSAFRMIQALSRHHLEQLFPISGPHLSQDFFGLFLQVKDKLLQEGMLSHYTHNPHLTALHSTDYLRANQVLGRERLAKSAKVDETETVSKSQDVDAAVFRNTGFVFFFLENKGSSHRQTDFGEYRYTVPLSAQPAILSDAWAILHDMAGQPKSGRAIRHAAPASPPEGGGQRQDANITRRIFERVDSIDAAIDLSEQLQPSLAPYLDPAASLFNMLTMFLPTAEQKIRLQTPDGVLHDTEIQDHLSGNFLQGADIIDGIALRIAHELFTLQEANAEEFNAVMSGSDAFWDYVSGAVHDVQIMVPHDVLPEQYDFISRPEPSAASVSGSEEASAAGIIARPVGAELPGMRRFGGMSADAAGILRLRPGSANNCFFEAMSPLMNLPGLGNANALRNRFVEQQNARHLPPLPPGAPVEYQHIQQFADIFQVTITVMVQIPNRDGRGTDAAGMGRGAHGAETALIDFVPQNGGSQSHYYIRFLPPADPNGIGHFTGLG